MRSVKVNINDSSVGIWQDCADDPTFRSEIFQPLLRQLKRRGWQVSVDADIKSRYPSLSKNNRIVTRGDLVGSVELTGRVIKVEVWATTWPIDNRNGPRYDFRKLSRMAYLDRLRVLLEHRRIVEWLRGRTDVTVKDLNAGRVCRGASTALKFIHDGYDESWHRDKIAGRPLPGPYVRNFTSADGLSIEHGSTVWFAHTDGRIHRGTAYYNLNNMWWVVCGPYVLRNLGAHELFCNAPANLRAKHNQRQRRLKLEAELSSAVRRMDFVRADQLKRILFGNAAPWMIYARDHNAYYRANYSGYTTDTISAGRYTRDEAEKEARRVPHELEIHGPDAERIRFDRAAA
ncbi:MAG: hypothetical protein P0Y65_05585 [Candidatus Devosia phytovorans]|uniref:UVR domain-containing protein n=1 Tax=Candidatus Devosia phytovorans TaxID=3121372 RepID=A0AAJ5VVL6_9HYPH|nr:hypothetical protein [Devosia sp.]WEK05726.1 MAG: hypothetical protein P0Y65_05585 [Devosia sp.]